MALPARLRNQLSTSDIMSLPVGIDPLAGGSIYDDREVNIDLRWPLGIEVWEIMRHDPQIAGLLQAIKLPLKRAGRSLKGDDVSHDVMEAANAEFSLGDAQPKGRRRRRNEGVNFDMFLEEMLTALIYGHSVFEQVYEPGPPFPGQENAKLKTMAHVRKLAFIHPRIIRDWHIDQWGSLKGIKVSSLTGTNYLPNWIYLPIDTLVVFTQNKIGANWWGESMFRPLYKPWYLKDAAERVGAMAIDRQGLGIPHVQWGPGGNLAEARRIGMDLRAGSTNHVAHGLGQYVIEIIGQKAGELVDPGPSIDRNNQSMSKAWLAQIMDLGHSVGLGSGNMGETFLEMFCDGINALAKPYAEIITEHVIRDYVELNWGENEPYPEFQFAPVTPQIAAEMLSSLVSSGLITPTEDMEKALRQRYGLPELKPGDRDKHAADKAAQAADAAKQMNDAVPPTPGQPGQEGGGAGPKAPASPRPPAGTTKLSGNYDLSALKEWDSKLHPRVPRGQHGGEFTSKGGLSPLDLPDRGVDLHMASLPEPVRQRITEVFTANIATPEQALKNLDEASDAMWEEGPSYALACAAFYSDAHEWGAKAAAQRSMPTDTFLASAAALSPGRAWQQNKDVAERIADRMDPEHLMVLTPEVADHVNEVLERDRFNDMRRRAGKELGFEPERKLQGDNDTIWQPAQEEQVMARVALMELDEPPAYHAEAGQDIQTVAEENVRAAAVALATDAHIGVGYGYDTIEAAVRVYKYGPEAIQGPKPRSFYNNLMFPKDPNGDVTIDVWHWRAMTLGTKPVPENGATLKRLADDSSIYTGTPSIKGVQVGTYPLAADITREATARFNQRHGTHLLVNEYQALVWFGMRDGNNIGVVRKAKANA